MKIYIYHLKGLTCKQQNKDIKKEGKVKVHKESHLSEKASWRILLIFLAILSLIKIIEIALIYNILYQIV